MTTLLKNASYLKITHSGQTTGSLLLADLADEENAKQEKKIPVYVPENGSITIPLDEDVLLSYQQGTIRGLEDQGYLTTTLLDANPEDARIWVGPNGNDDNPGTYHAPYASIQKAIDDLVEQVGIGNQKTVMLREGTYNEQVLINTDNITVLGESEYAPSTISVDTGPAVMVSNLSKAGFDAILTEDPVGLSATTDPDAGTFTYTGPTLTGRDVNLDLDPVTDSFDAILFMDVELRNIEFNTDSAENGLQVVGVPHDGNNEVLIRSMEFRNISGSMYMKNGLANSIESRFENLILDNSMVRELRMPRSSTLSGAEGVSSPGTGDLFAIRMDSSVQSTEGAPETSIFYDVVFYNITPDFQWYNSNVEFYLGASSEGIFSGSDTRTFALTGFDESNRMVANGTGSLTKAPNTQMRLGASKGDVEIKGSVSCEVGELIGRDIDKSSDAIMTVQEIKARRNVTISGGTSNTINGGLIEGDLTVNSPATVDLTNVVVKGNLEGDGDITMTGGGYGGANNNTGTLTYNALGTT